jgi:transposase
VLANMGRRPGLSIDDRNIALGLLEGGLRAPDVARRFGCNERTIYRIQAFFRETGSVKYRPRSGRPRKTTP